jgi:hypothetical protein
LQRPLLCAFAVHPSFVLKQHVHSFMPRRPLSRSDFTLNSKDEAWARLWYLVSRVPGAEA